MALNPFIWTRPLDDPSKIVGMDAFAHQVAMRLKAQTNVALFGPRDTGKTTFTHQLALELAKAHGDDAPPFVVVRINLQRVLSIPGFSACVHDALVKHPEKAIRRVAQKQLTVLQKEIGFDIKIVKGSIKRTGVTPEQDAEALHAQLGSIATLADHVVVVFDEFQRLDRCPGDPLAIIRSALMSTGANHVSLLLTGSIREALKMMLDRSNEPIFGEAAAMQLPAIDPVDFLEYLEFNFEATDKPAGEDALNHLIRLTGSHPKRTQQLAWEVWEGHRATSTQIEADQVQDAYERLISAESTEFHVAFDMLADGGESETNELRALILLADRGGDNVTSRDQAGLYGFSSHGMVPKALHRLRRRGLVEEDGKHWRIVDPLFAGWLRLQSPLGDTD